MRELNTEAQDEAQNDLVVRFFPTGAPDAGAVTEEAVRRIIGEVDQRIREEGAGHVPEDPGLTEEVFKYMHTF